MKHGITKKRKTEPDGGEVSPLELWHSNNPKEVERIAKSLLNPRRKWYGKWKIVKRERVGNFVVLLCNDKRFSDEYVVFTDLLMSGSIPTDKFTGGKKYGLELFHSTVRKLAKGL